MRGRAEITIADESVLEALVPEVKYPPYNPRVKFEIKGNKIIIEAEDLRALRAAVNSFLYWIYSATESLRAVEKSHELATPSPEASSPAPTTADVVRESSPAEGTVRGGDKGASKG